MHVFIVKCSNCESYEDYHEYIDSVWSDYDAAVNHIENKLDMKKVNFYNPAKPCSRDRWQKEFPDYPRKEDFKDDPEGWKDCFDEKGELMPYWVSYQDAWILEFQVYNISED